MKRVILSLTFACAIFLLYGQTQDARIPVNFQEVMIPMRDGVRLQTVILSPKDPKGLLPFLIQRTPYGVPAKRPLIAACPPPRAPATKTTTWSRRISAAVSNPKASS
jgi:predicted acyl esterase